MSEPNKWKVYRERKLEIKKLNLPPEEYHRVKQELIKELGLLLK